MSETTRMEMPKLACGAVVAIGYAAAFISVTINARYGQRMSVDIDGYWLQAALLLVLSLGPAILTSYSGFAWRAGTWLKASGAFLFAAALMVFSAWNVNDFVASQMLGKLKNAEYRQQARKDLAEIKNNLTVEERKALHESLLNKYRTGRTKEERDDAMAKIEALGNRPVALEISDAIVVTDARSDTLKKLFGTDRDTVQSIAPLGAALLMVLVELLCPFLGFSGWPTSVSSEEQEPPKNPRFGSLRPKPPLAAFEDLKKLMESGAEIPNQKWLADRWNCSESVVCDRLNKWGIERKPNGRGKANKILPFPVNGHAKQ